MKLLPSQKQMIKTATKVQLENALKETIINWSTSVKIKEAIEKELKNRK
tara:strand:- start:506 stop:652 length:147 start_codon:yes stop_codon:yes gene_type:complete